MSDLAYNIASAILVLGVLAGISLMSHVRLALLGNRLSAVCTALAVLLTLYRNHLLSDGTLWIAMASGLVIGLIIALRIKMIKMPQMIALLNGLGGASSALIVLASLIDGAEVSLFFRLAAGIALIVGLVTLSGSLVAAGKLHQLIAASPVIWPSHQALTTGSILLLVIGLVALAANWLTLGILLTGLIILSLIFGFAFAIRIGGADMPITISLLNSLSGVAGSIAGMAINDPLLVAIGGVVGASGLLLTQIMCKAMNRSLADILMGKTANRSELEGGINAAGTDEPTDPEAAETAASGQSTAHAPTHHMSELELSASILRHAKSVIIVPGYGMALAQAQGMVKQLADQLSRNGSIVQYAIHPVAGRMPGHMNVLLCEVDVPYEDLHEMDEINPQFETCDAVLVVGANDVINPAANTAIGTPIYGMPVLEVNKARQIIICNYDLKPGYSGVDNPLYTRKSGVMLLLGDASQTLAELAREVDASQTLAELAREVSG